MRESYPGGKPWLLALLLCIVFVQTAVAQQIILEPTKARNSNGQFISKLLLKENRTVRVDWQAPAGGSLNLDGRQVFLKLGNLPNSYTTLQLPVSGTFFEFRPDNVNLPPGRYYARLTNASGNRMSEILSEFGDNPSGIVYSNEIQIIVESPTAAFAIEPRGDITESTPTFSWEAVPGAVGYWVIVSSTPFQIEDNDGEISIVGVTGVWQYMTTETSATYGSIVDAFPDEPPPLNDGQEYSYTILNLYEEENPVFVSPVFGGIIPFRYNNPNAIPAPSLQSPANNIVIAGDPLITFRWDEVPGATNYTVRLSKRLTQSGAEVSLPVWTTTTTNTLVDFNAAGVMENTRYTWSVIANDDFGRGTSSEQREFRYQIETGRFSAFARNEADGSALTGVEIRALAVSGGSTSAISYLLQTGSVVDSLVAGTYEFTAKKAGFRDAVTTAEVRANESVNVRLNMEALPSGVSGRVLDDSGQPSANATVVTTNLATSEQFTSQTNTSGNFNQSLQPGSYSISVNKPGYLPPATQFYDIALGEQITITDPITIQNDLATISGFVFNQAGNPIQLARVTASRGGTQLEALTNGQGYYSLNVSSGTWSMRAQKTGFVSPPVTSVSLGAGDNVQNQNFNLPSGANQVSGTVRRVVTNADGSVGLAAFAGVVVTAIPTVGNPVSATTGNNGQYSLSLPSGIYTIQLARDGFTPSGQTSLNLSITETVTGVDFELRPNPSSIAGRVTRNDGTGIGNVTVSIPGVSPVTTTASGNYTISVPEGTHEISVFRSGFATPSPQSVALSPGQNLTGVDFTMSANAGQITGRTTSSGQALSAVTITTTALATNTTATQQTNNEGNYTLSVRPGTYTIQASRSGFLPSRIDTVTVGPGQQLTNLNYALTENLARIRGLVSSNDVPIRNVQVTLRRADGTPFEQSTLTLVNGSYSFAVPGGFAYTVQTSATGYSNVTRQTDVLPASTVPVELDLVISPNPASVAGTVRTSGGVSMSGVRIRALDTATQQVTDSTVTSTNGNYSLGLPAGSYEISASRAGYETQSSSVSLQVGQNITGVDYQLPENFALIQGILRDNDGVILEDVLVNLRSASGAGATTTTNSAGSFSVGRLTTDTYSLKFEKAGYIASNQSVAVQDGGFRELEINLQAATGSISGVVLDVSGDPVPEAEVVILDTDGRETQAQTDAQGLYAAANLSPATYVITANKTGFGSADPVNVTLSLDALEIDNANIDDLVPNDASISGIASNSATGSALQGVQVSVSGPGGAGSATTDNEGRYVVSNLGPGTYSVSYSRDNFRSSSTEITLTPSLQQAADVSLIRNAGRISGRVTNQNGSPLNQAADVILSTDTEQYRTRSDVQGNFEITNLPTGVAYRAETAIFRNGYANADQTVDYPLGEDLVNVDLVVQVNEGRITGNTATSETTVRLIRESDGSVITTTQASLDGTYSFSFLPAGEYRLRFSKPGFVFNPSTTPVFNLSFDQALEVNTTAQANIGNILVTTTSEGNPLNAVQLSIISADNQISRQGVTAQDGTFRFAEVPAGQDYTVTATLRGFTANPSNRTVSVTAGNTVSAGFDMIAGSSNINGVTRALSAGTTTTLGAVAVRAVNLQTGVSVRANSDASGRYAFEGIPAGNYEIVANRSGYVPDTVRVEVDRLQTISNADLVLEPSLFSLRGRVVLRGAGVPGVEVSLISSTTRTANTNNNGFYVFNDLPIRTGATDTTVYQVSFEVGGTTYSSLIRATSDNLGTSVTAPQVILPSGVVAVAFTDGVNPLSGVNVNFRRVGGSVSTSVTGTDGTFTSSQSLRQSQYEFTYQRIGYLTPQAPVRVNLDSDTTQVSLTAKLPYRHNALTEIRADEAASVTVTFPELYDNATAIAALFYRAGNEDFTRVDMSRSNGQFTAEIPSLFRTDDITYYVSVTDDGMTYRTTDVAITPLASGILSSIRFTPQVNQQILRVGDTYQLRLDIADGISQSLNDEFGSEGNGTVEWAENTGITVNDDTGTTYSFTPQTVGSYVLSATVTYQGVEVVGQQSITVVDDPITSMDVRTSVNRASNTAPLLFSNVATDAQGRRQLLGSALQWTVEPEQAGTITSNGLFRAASDEYIGQIQITATDSRTGVSRQSDPVTIFAQVRPERSYTFTDLQGMSLEVPVNSVENVSEITVRNVTPETVKKHVFLENTADSYITSDVVYRFNLSSGAFISPVELQLPVDASHDFNLGNKLIALFNRSSLVWSPFTSETVGESVRASGLTQMGQFSVLAQTEPLGIKHLSVLPSPFSPDVAPLRIGYMLTTQAPPAVVNISIFNIRGELVRTLLRDDLQQQGRYGSRSGIKEITWDGLTDAGLMARNGRYVIRVHVRDADDEQVQMIPVVLIK